MVPNLHQPRGVALRRGPDERLQHRENQRAPSPAHPQQVPPKPLRRTRRELSRHVQTELPQKLRVPLPRHRPRPPRRLLPRARARLQAARRERVARPRLLPAPLQHDQRSRQRQDQLFPQKPEKEPLPELAPARLRPDFDCDDPRVQSRDDQTQTRRKAAPLQPGRKPQSPHQRLVRREHGSPRQRNQRDFPRGGAEERQVRAQAVLHSRLHADHPRIPRVPRLRNEKLRPKSRAHRRHSGHAQQQRPELRQTRRRQAAGHQGRLPLQIQDR